MPKKGAAANKQSDRNATKKAAKAASREDDDGPAAADGQFTVFAKQLVIGSVILEYAPKLQPMLQEAIAAVKEAKKENGEKPKEEAKEESEDKDEKAEKEENGDKEEKEEASGENGSKEEKAENGSKPETGSALEMFSSITSRLVWHNSLGLAMPFSGEDAKKAWIDMKGLELDWGPRARKNWNPIFDRVGANLTGNLPQYLHILLALMMLRSFLFRSYFACLPWLVFYQLASLMLPLDQIPQVPALPLDKVDVKFRVAITVGLNALVWLFFLIEAVWRTWWLEKFFVAGVFCSHAYVVRPAGK